MDELTDAATALAAVLRECDEHQRFGSQLRERLPILLALQNQVCAAIARTVRAGELTGLPEVDGLKSMASWLRGHGHLSGAAAAKLITAGRAMDQLPALSAAATNGAVTVDQVTVIAQITSTENLAAADAAGIDLAEVDTTLTDLATHATHKDTVAALGHYLTRLDPDGPEPDPTEGRGLTLPPRGDGTRGVHGQLDAVGGEKVAAALESIAQANRPAGDTRSRAQQLADALVQLCDSYLAAGTLPILRGRKAQIGVLIGFEDFLDPATAPGAGTMEFGAAISAARARMLACDADIIRILIGPDSQPLDIGRAQRIVPPHLRKAVEIRDKNCVFAGCGAPKYWCDVHHIIHWIFDGETSLENSALLCERHHTQVHHGFTIARQEDNTYRTYRPDGTEIITGPHTHTTQTPPGAGPPEQPHPPRTPQHHDTPATPTAPTDPTHPGTPAPEPVRTEPSKTATTANREPTEHDDGDGDGDKAEPPKVLTLDDFLNLGPLQPSHPPVEPIDITKLWNIEPSPVTLANI